MADGTGRWLPLGLAGVAAILWAASEPAFAQSNYPDRTIKIVSTVAPGSTADAIFRIVADKLSERFRKPVFIENRVGGANNLGADIVAGAQPDGYTLLAVPPGPLVISQHLDTKLGFDPSAFVPVSVVASLPFVLVISDSVPASNLQELVAYAKANPDKINYAPSGVGSLPHLTTEMLNAAAGIRTTHVPYGRGMPAGLNDLLGGRIDMMFDNLGNMLPHIRSGRLKALGIGNAERISEMPALPSISETYPGFRSATWFAIAAPPKTAETIAATLSQAIAEAVRSPDVVAKFLTLSAKPVGNSPSEMRAFLTAESDNWRNLIRSARIRVE
jgi:tripartite-type tricarboxylate transporter receptor subunit TctC